MLHPRRNLNYSSLTSKIAPKVHCQLSCNLIFFRDAAILAKSLLAAATLFLPTSSNPEASDTGHISPVFLWNQSASFLLQPGGRQQQTKNTGFLQDCLNIQDFIGQGQKYRNLQEIQDYWEDGFIEYLLIKE